jgi:hypothetical protein
MPQALNKNRCDDVEQIVAALRSDPRSLEDVKRLLKNRKARGTASSRPSVSLSVVAISDDADEMWDNVPV